MYVSRKSIGKQQNKLILAQFNGKIDQNIVIMCLVVRQNA